MAGKVAFHTLGCKLNFSETSAIGNQFLQKGFDIVDFKEEADVYVINTCTVTENAEKECRQIVRKAMRQNPGAFVAVTGCYAQLRADEISKIVGVDAVLGSNEKFKLFEYFEQFEKQEYSCVYVSPSETLNEYNSAYSTDADSRTRAFLKIQDGCDYKCTFCTIPLARGKSRSLETDSSVEEFKSLIQDDYKEIVLTGVNVGDYGKKFDTNLFSLLQNFLKVNGDYRIRISSIEPNLLTDEIIDLTASEERMANHFHIPLQSGSEKMLKLMQRRYKLSDYEKLINRVISKIPDVGIGIDVIVGSPGETEKDFLDTYNFLKELPFSYLHVFTYSARPNTKAIDMPGHVELKEKKRRNNMLRILSEKKRNLFYRNMIGKELEVLFEKTENNGFIQGFTSNYVKVHEEFNFDLVNKFKKVKITDVVDNYCTTNSKKAPKVLAG